MLIFLFFSVGLIVAFTAINKPAKSSLINAKGCTLQTRFNLPTGFERKPLPANSFGAYLRNLPLKPDGAKVHYYDGTVKTEDVYDAVVNLDIGNKDLEQCADAVIRLRGEYLYALKEYDKIAFNFTNGFNADYSEWIKGNRIVVNGNNVSWRKSAAPSNTYKDFREYMDEVFTYAGTLSLSKSLKSKDIKDIAIGDVFIKGGSPGHAEIVVDVAENAKGEKLFMLAQSYMPAQETQILKNPTSPMLSPWYNLKYIGDVLVTPQWTFTSSQLKGW